MPGHMVAQTGATARNTQAELLVDTALRLAFDQLQEEGLVANVRVSHQVPFQRDDCSDVFDHRVDFDLSRSVEGLSARVQLWAQTTCYKGHTTKANEPNKTYEIRETLIEALGLRRWLRAEDVSFRIAHFTVGPAAYAYPWFKDAKRASFDLSLYPPEDSSDLFKELDTLLLGSRLETTSRARITEASSGGSGPVASYINATVKAIVEWARGGFGHQRLADEQVALLANIREDRIADVSTVLEQAQRGGAAIKPRVLAVLGGDADEETDDATILRTAAQVADAKPFLAEALRAEADWTAWCERHLPEPNDSLRGYVRRLWELPEPARGITRRILLRIHSPSGVPYVADLGVEGVSEHTLYSGKQTNEQIDRIISRIGPALENAGIATPGAVRSQLASVTGRRLLKLSRRAESVNGTNIRPSFFYVAEALPEGYTLVKFRDTHLPPPRGYHSSFTEERVRSYTNIGVIVRTSDGAPQAIVKAKFFSQAEFARRVKEESYVGLTLMYEHVGDRFRSRYKDLPLIMFVDMDVNTSPPDYAIVRLVTAGWQVVFNIDQLVAVLDR